MYKVMAIAVSLMFAPVNTKTVTVIGDTDGCLEETYYKLKKFKDQGDQAAYDTAIGRAYLYGNCVPYSDGEQLYYEGESMQLVQVRRPGMTRSFWVDKDRVK